MKILRKRKIKIGKKKIIKIIRKNYLFLVLFVKQQVQTETVSGLTMYGVDSHLTIIFSDS